MNGSPRFQLSGNELKIIAAVTMFLDHMGLMLLPRAAIFRYIGRLAFPIFAFMIAEGCKYTRNRRRYWGNLAILAALCQIVYFFFDGSAYLCILVTFSLSILMIYALDRLKSAPNAVNMLIFSAVLLGVFALNRLLEIDYGFWGCMVPLFAALPVGTAYDSIPVRVGMLGLGLIFLSLSIGGMQWFSLLSLPLLLCYSGKRGKANMKYSFYIFYPAHLVFLEAIAVLTG